MSAQHQRPHLTGSVVWFEIPVSDLDKSQAFYEAMLGIKMLKNEDPNLPNPMVDFQDPGTPGGFGHLYPGKPSQMGTGNTIHMLTAERLEDVMPRVEPAGGKLKSPIVTIPAGRFAYIEDIDGNSIGLFNWE